MVVGDLVLFQHPCVSALVKFFHIDRFKCCLCTAFGVLFDVCRFGDLVWFVVLDAHLCIFKSAMNH